MSVVDAAGGKTCWRLPAVSHREGGVQATAEPPAWAGGRVQRPAIDRMKATVFWAIRSWSLSSVATW